MRRMIGESKFVPAIERSLVLINRYPHDGLIYATLVEVSLYARSLQEAEVVLGQMINKGDGIEQSTYGLGLVRYHQERYTEAMTLFLKAAEFGNKDPDCYRYLSYSEEKVYGPDEAIRRLSLLCHAHPASALLWYALGLVYWGKRDFEEAFRAFDEAVDRDRSEVAFEQARVAVAFLGGRLRDPERTLLNLLAVAEKSADFSACQFIRSYLLMLRSARGDEEGWRSVLEVTVSEAKEYGLAKWLGWANEKLADYSLWHANPDLAARSAKESLAASRLCGDESLIVTSSIRLFEAYMELGRYVEASQILLDRLKGVPRSKLDPDSIRALLDVARLYHEIGEDAFAMVFAVEGLVRAKAIKPTPTLLFLGNTVLGCAYQGLGDKASAEKIFRDADGYAAKIPRNEFFRAIAKGNLGNACLMRDKVENAGEFFHEQLYRSRRSNFIRELVYAEFNLGEYWSKRGDGTRAKRYYSNAYRMGSELHLGPVTLMAASRLGRIAIREGNTPNAISYFERVAGLVDAMVGRFVGAGGPTGLQMIGIEACKEISIGFARLKVFSSAFQWTEEARRREFAATRKLACKSCCKYVDSILSAEHLNGYATLAAQAYTPANDSPDDRIHSLVQLLSAEVSFPTQCTNTKRNCSDESEVSTNLEELVKASRKGESFLGFTVTESCLLAIVASSGKLTAEIISITGPELRRIIAQAFPPVTRPSLRTKLRGICEPELSATESHRLYRLLFTSIGPNLAKSNRLIVIADDELRSVPFEALVTTVDSSKCLSTSRGLHYLIERQEILYDISFNRWFQMTRLDPPREVLLVGREESQVEDNFLPTVIDPKVKGLLLPGIRREISLVKDMLQDCCDVLYGVAATKQRLEELAPYYTIVHVASHAKEDLSVPQHTILTIASDAEDNSQGPKGWTAWESTSIFWRASLVVLSACNTIGGRNGVGPRGFVGSLRIAGVACIVGALSDIDDQTTPAFMAGFYRYLKGGMSSSAALREVKLQLIREGAATTLWSNFVAYGRGERAIMDAKRDGRGNWSFESQLALCLYALLIGYTSLCVALGARYSPIGAKEDPTKME